MIHILTSVWLHWLLGQLRKQCLGRARWRTISTKRAKCSAGKSQHFSLMGKLSGGQKELAAQQISVGSQMGLRGRPHKKRPTQVCFLLLENVTYDEHYKNMNEMRKKTTHKPTTQRLSLWTLGYILIPDISLSLLPTPSAHPLFSISPFSFLSFI